MLKEYDNNKRNENPNNQNTCLMLLDKCYIFCIIIIILIKTLQEINRAIIIMGIYINDKKFAIALTKFIRFSLPVEVNFCSNIYIKTRFMNMQNSSLKVLITRN